MRASGNGIYVITDGNGSYIHRNDDNKYVTIRNEKQATQWDNIAKANSVLNNMIPKNIRSNYAVLLLETEKVVEKDEDKVSEICFRSIDNGNIQEWQDRLKTVIETLSSVDQRRTELGTKLSEVDKEIVDIEHYIEFGNFNAYQGWMCFKMLQNLFRQRRKYKNEINVIEMMKQCKINNSALLNLSQNIAEVSNQRYKPRAFPELFKSGK